MSRTGATPSSLLERLEQRALDQEVGAEDVMDAGVLGLAAGLQQPDLQHLARVVPLVDRRVDVETFVALQPDQPGAEARRQDLGELGLADAGLALEEERPAELQREEDGRGERPVRDVVTAPKVVLDRLDGAGAGRARVAGLEVGGIGHRRNLHAQRACRSVPALARSLDPSRSAPGPVRCRHQKSTNSAAETRARGGGHTVGYRDRQRIEGEQRLAKARKGETTLSVLRTEDVPLQEVSGVCLRREAGGDMALVAFGDRTSIAAWVDLPDDDRGAYVWKTVDLADVEGSLIPR